MSLRTRHPRHCEHHAIHGTRCMECGCHVQTPSWVRTRVESPTR
jgi:hypothetical protein